MDEQRKKLEMEKDAFWDFSELIPRRTEASGYPRPVEPTELTLSPSPTEPNTKETQSDTVIKRYIPPHSENRLSYQNEFETSISYTPSDSLIHKVTLKKRKCTYRYYSEFLQDALRYRDQAGTPCDYVPFFSYVPQYSQMNEAQRSYYLWFRSAFQKGIEIPIDYSYVLLYVFELINLGNPSNAEQSRDHLIDLWERYHEAFPAISGKLGEWICDFSLLHRLAPPARTCAELVGSVPSLKEFYISMPNGDTQRCARSLLKYCSSYDYRKSKFAQGDDRALFDRHIFEALLTAIRHYSADGMLLSGIRLEDSVLIRDLYAGALCTSEQRYRMEVEYCSFSRSNELRFLVGDIIKYSENKIRAYLGVKSKMTVYSVTAELRTVLDAYFAQALPVRRATPKSKEKQAYEVLYESPKQSLSLSNAAKIEAESWETTRDLVDAFEEESEAPLKREQEEPPLSAEGETEDTLRSRLGAYWDVVCGMLSGDLFALDKAAREKGKMSDALADEINDLAYDVMGDALVEETTGGYCVIDEYRELIEQLREGDEQNGTK